MPTCVLVLVHVGAGDLGVTLKVELLIEVNVVKARREYCSDDSARPGKLCIEWS